MRAAGDRHQRRHRARAKLNGRILPGGSDWQIIRADGAADIQARYTIESDTGARILVYSAGLRHGPPEVMARLAKGDNVDPSLYISAPCCGSRPPTPRRMAQPHSGAGAGRARGAGGAADVYEVE